MPKSHPPYAPEFRCQMVDLVVNGFDTPRMCQAFQIVSESFVGCRGFEGNARVTTRVARPYIRPNEKSQAEAWLSRRRAGRRLGTQRSAHRSPQVSSRNLLLD